MLFSTVWSDSSLATLRGLCLLDPLPFLVCSCICLHFHVCLVIDAEALFAFWGTSFSSITQLLKMPDWYQKKVNRQLLWFIDSINKSFINKSLVGDPPTRKGSWKGRKARFPERSLETERKGSWKGSEKKTSRIRKKGSQFGIQLIIHN